MSFNPTLSRGILRRSEGRRRHPYDFFSENHNILYNAFNKIQLFTVIKRLQALRNCLADEFYYRTLLTKYLRWWKLRTQCHIQLRKICTSVKYIDFYGFNCFYSYLQEHKLQEIFDSDFLYAIFSLHFQRRKLLRKFLIKWKNNTKKKIY
ncbi:uncharacterized protein LOC119652579 [Hermetia illucens]|uniref:uncharacterized protein LOC119652579 n=1 Tax=Hermetia illucens TaxID=343691 RepID=UPI0018CC2366|nr:uncharacterized protein LOC119652579 [Hermetia illucens]